MANYNYSGAIKTANKYGITDVQIIQGKNPRQCTSIIYKGVKVSTSTYTLVNFENLFYEIKATGNLNSYVTSVAKQKVSEAWGITEEARQHNRKNQNRTYADNLNHISKLYGRKLSDVVAEYICDYACPFDKWEHDIIHFYSYDEDMDGNVIEYKNGPEKAKQVMQRLLQTQGIIKIKENIYTRNGLYNLIKNWHGENDIQITPEGINKYIDMIYNVYGEKV